MSAEPRSMSPLTEMERARRETLQLVTPLGEDVLRAWPDADFSPVGWHLGHVAFTEARWVVGRLQGDPSLHEPVARQFAQDGRPKHERSDLPSRDELLGYMERVRERVRRVARETRGAPDPLLRDGFLWWFIAAHEHQHRETMAFVLTQRCVGDPGRAAEQGRHLDAVAADDPEDPPVVEVPGGVTTQGTDAPLVYDNERRAHDVRIEPFRLDTHPVTCGAWARFMRAGGYDDPSLWSEPGWAWRRGGHVRSPFAWIEVAPGHWAHGRIDGCRPLDGREPVFGISFHEAEAFARFRGARLPTEPEWEHACKTYAQARPRVCDLETPGPVPVLRRSDRPTDLLGQVWEWTASWFEPYPGFEPFPYRGYSVPYFGGTHRVLRGGSFATSAAVARPTFRNWYLPHIRQLFAGLRCAAQH